MSAYEDFVQTWVVRIDAAHSLGELNAVMREYYRNPPRPPQVNEPPPEVLARASQRYKELYAESAQ